MLRDESTDRGPSGATVGLRLEEYECRGFGEFLFGMVQELGRCNSERFSLEVNLLFGVVLPNHMIWHGLPALERRWW